MEDGRSRQSLIYVGDWPSKVRETCDVYVRPGDAELYTLNRDAWRNLGMTDVGSHSFMLGASHDL